MLNPDQITQLKDLVNSSQTIFVIFPVNPKQDLQMAAKALHLSLSSLPNKNVALLGPDNKDLTEAKTEVGNKNLQISFPYSEGMVDKVSYDIDEESNRFYLLIQPSGGTRPLDYKQIEYAYTGAEADLIFLVGVSDFAKLEQLYEGYEGLYEDATVVSLNTYESNIGDVKLNGSGKTGLSEMTVEFLEKLDLNLPIDAATCLLTGLESATDNFASLTATANTFEMAARLMRLGARRSKRTNIQSPISNIQKKDNFAKALEKKKKENLLIKKPALHKKTKGKKKRGGLDHRPGMGGR
ncbi:MAG: hypothetical protein ABFQ62_01990 [Patescibacteria group bacterium]